MKVAVCDDDKKLLSNLVMIIENAFHNFGMEIEAKSYNNGKMLLLDHSENKFDVIFLDIDMPDVSGFDVAQELREHFDKCQIVFVTSHTELVYQSFDFQPFNFIQKNSETIDSDIGQVVKKLIYFSKQNQTICLKDEWDRDFVVSVRDVMYIESSGHYVYYYLKGNDKSVKVRQRMSACVEKFIPLDFVHVHKQYLVNLRYLESIDMMKDEVKIAEVNKKLVMSRNYKKEVRGKYLEYLRNQV